jgi:hypothetical protein
MAMVTVRNRFMIVPVLLAFMGAAAGIWMLSSDEPEDEEQIREAILQVVEGARRADIKQVMTPISLAYRDDDGLSRDKLKGYLFLQFRRRGPIHAWLSAIQVSVAADGRSADAAFTVALGEGGEGIMGELLPQTGEVLSFHVQLSKEESVWRIAGHERFDLDGEPVSLPGQ